MGRFLKRTLESVIAGTPRFVVALWLACAVSMCLPAVGNAQELSGSIKGQVTDPSGALVGGARVRATNTDTGITKSAVSDGEGRFEFLQLKVGKYDVAVEKGGFKTYTLTGLTLVLNQIYTVSARLDLGSTTETITVEAVSNQVETSTSQLSTVIDSAKIVDLPLNGRNWTQLQQLAPGVTGASDRFGVYSTNGGQTQQNSYLINGADSINLLTNTPGITPSPDAIQEFNLITSTINAEYSRNGGGILNAVIKSGTNHFHGSAFEFYRDTFLDAHNYFQRTAPEFHQNQFGGTIGGPIWKDHTFAFFSYQGTRARQPQTGSGLVSVFSDSQRTGDFSNGTGTCPFGANVSPIALKGSNGVTQPAGTPYCTLFPTGVIPASDINSISSQFLGSIPHANFGNNQFSFNPISRTSQDQEILRIDHNFSGKDAIWGSMFLENFPITDTLSFPPYGPTLPGWGDISENHNKNFSVDWMRTFDATAVNEFRVSYQRINQSFASPQNVVDPSGMGFNVTPQDKAAQSVPFVSVFGLFSVGYSLYGPQFITNQNYQIADNFSKNHGKHTLKFGFSGTRYGLNYLYDVFNNGEYSFAGFGTFSTGVPGADFLLGFPDSFGQSTPGRLDSRSYEYYVYAQDEWKVRTNLTVNYGLGYQIDTPLNNFAFGGLGSNCFTQGVQSTVFPTAPKGVLFPTDPGCSQSGYYTKYGHLGPRVGFSYSPDAKRKLAIRGGFGIYYNRNVGEIQNPFLTVSPFNLFQAGVGQIGGSPSFANPWSGWTLSGPSTVTPVSFANPYPFAPPGRGAKVDFSQFLPLGLTVTDPNFTSAYTMNFNLNVQRELPGKAILQVGYVGAVGRHLNLVRQLNPISLAGAADCIADPTCRAFGHSFDFQNFAFPNHFSIYPGNVVSGISDEVSDGVSSYNSFQASLTKRLTHGLSLLASYTWSHSIDNGSGYEDSIGQYGAGYTTNPFNPGRDRGDSAFDARHRFVVSYQYELPGINRFTNNRIAKAVINGWRIAGITTLQSGFPFSVTDSSDPSYTLCGCDTANLVGEFRTLNPRNNPEHLYIDTSAFQPAPIGQFGNLSRNAFHGYGINNTDALIAKRIPIRESRFVEVRLEAFNLLNYTTFGTPVYDIHSPLFGRVISAGPGRVLQLGGKFYF